MYPVDTILGLECFPVNFDERMAELQGQGWEAVMLKETWRTDLEKMWTTKQVHTFAGRGHDSGRKSSFCPTSWRVSHMGLGVFGLPHW